MKPKQIGYIIVAILFLLAFSGDSALGFRCGTVLVSAGDTKYEVIHKCGDPDSIEVWEEGRIKGYIFGANRHYTKHKAYGKPRLAKINVTIEEWMYNLGPHRFIRFLRFENGRLRKITTGHRGY